VEVQSPSGLDVSQLARDVEAGVDVQLLHPVLGMTLPDGRLIVAPSSSSDIPIGIIIGAVIGGIALIVLVVVIIVLVVKKKRHNPQQNLYVPLHNETVMSAKHTPRGGGAPVANVFTLTINNACEGNAAESLLACTAGEKLTVERSDWEGTSGEWVWATGRQGQGYVPRLWLQ